MEIIAELILSFILEILLPVIGEVFLELGIRSLGEPFVRREKRNPVIAGLGYSLLGLIFGGISLLIFPHSFIRSESFHGINLLITPVVAGFAMSGLGWLRRPDEPVLRLDSFIYGFLFAFTMALVRFVYTT